MSYSEKPARSCHMCVIRKVKCDKKRPQCNQCVRRGGQCPGYESSADVNHVDSSTAIKATERSKKVEPPPPRVVSNLLPRTHLAYCFTQAVIAQPQPHLDELASCFFFCKFVRASKQRIFRGFLEFVIPFATTLQPVRHFKYVFDACALEAFNNNHFFNGNNLKIRISKLYAEALGATAAAVGDPRMAHQDATLAAVLLLGLFEGIAGTSSSLAAWSSHIQGAVELVRVRGSKQLQTKTGFDMFVAVRTLMIVNSLGTSRSPAVDIPWFTNNAVYDKQAAACEDLAIRAANLNAEADKLLVSVIRSPQDTQRILSLIQRCQSAEADFHQWVKALPNHFNWRTVKWVKHIPHDDFANSEVFPGRVDVYSNAWVTNFWSMARCSCILLLSVIIRCSAWVYYPADYRISLEYARATQICNEIITDAIASVPYQLGWLANQPKQLREQVPHEDCAYQEDNPRTCLGGYFLRVWVKGRLKYVATQLGIRSAISISKLNVRIPSMLITRDRLMTNNYTKVADFKQLSKTYATLSEPWVASIAPGSEPSNQEMLQEYYKVADSGSIT